MGIILKGKRKEALNSFILVKVIGNLHDYGNTAGLLEAILERTLLAFME